MKCVVYREVHLEKTFRIYDISFAANEMHGKLVEVHLEKKLRLNVFTTHAFRICSNEMLRNLVEVDCMILAIQYMHKYML